MRNLSPWMGFKSLEWVNETHNSWMKDITRCWPRNSGQNPESESGLNQRQRYQNQNDLGIVALYQNQYQNQRNQNQNGLRFEAFRATWERKQMKVSVCFLQLNATVYKCFVDFQYIWWGKVDSNQIIFCINFNFFHLATCFLSLRERNIQICNNYWNQITEIWIRIRKIKSENIRNYNQNQS